MECDISEDLFDKIIEYKSDEESEQGNTSELTQSHRKPTALQYKMMQDLFEYTEYTEIGREGYDKLWESLVPKLNGIGPPMHSNLEWRRKWTVHKHNLKKKQMTSSDTGTHRNRQTRSAEQTEGTSSKKAKSDVSSPLNHKEKSTAVQSESKDNNFQNIVLARLNDIIRNQEVMIGTMKLILDKLNSI